MIKFFLNNFLNNLSFKLFDNRLPYFYNLFLIIFNFKILNKRLLNQKNYIDIDSLNRDGFTKVEIKFDHKFKLLKEKLYKQKIFKNQNFQYRFIINNEISKLILEIYNSNIKSILNKLESFIILK